ncbi:MAG: outer membrane protein assembly factor, partial [Planctomycetota bacterium]
GSFSFGAGFSSQDSFVANGSLSQENLFGRGYSARLSADIGGRTQRYFLSISDPYFLGSNFSAGLTLFSTQINFQDFKQDQTGADFVLGHSVTEDHRTRGFLRYSWASRDIEQDSNVNAAGVIFRELIQDSLTSSLMGLAINSDTRNDRLSPSSGYLWAASLEFAGLGFFTQFFRAEASGSWYLGAPWWLLDGSTFVISGRVGYALPLNDVSDYEFLEVPDGFLETVDGNVRLLQAIDDDLTLPLSERYFLGGLGEFQLRGFKARSVGPRRAILRKQGDGLYIPVGRDIIFVQADDHDVPVSPGFPDAVPITVCTGSPVTGGNGNTRCNDISDKDIEDFEDLDETDVIGGNKFISSSLEYRFPISETLGLQGLVFLDTGNAFSEGENLFDVTEWRYGTGFGVQWFSPFGPLAVILGFPLDPLEDENSPVFEFSVGGQGF